MTTRLLERPLPEPDPDRKLWTRDEYLGLFENGALTGNYELLEGEVIHKMPQKMPHIVALRRVEKWANAVFGYDNVMTQNNIEIVGAAGLMNAPEPDVVALSQAVESFVHIPTSQDVLLLIEVSDTTRNRDLAIKAAVYARAGIADYWVLDLANRLLIAHREPGAEGYASVVAYAENEAVSPLACPNVSVLVSSLLPSLSAA